MYLSERLSKKGTTPNGDEDEETGSLIHDWLESKVVQPFWETVQVSCL